MNLVQDSASVIISSQHHYVRVVHPNTSAETRISSQALAARSLQLVKVEPAVVDKVTSSRMRVRGGRLEPDDDIEFFYLESQTVVSMIVH